MVVGPSLLDTEWEGKWDGEGEHTQERKTPATNAQCTPAQPLGLPGPGQVAAPIRHRVHLGQAPGIRAPRFLSVKRAPQTGRATL